MALLALSPAAYAAAPPGRLHANLFSLPRGFIHRGDLYCASEVIEQGEVSKDEIHNQYVSLWRLPLAARPGKAIERRRYEYISSFLDGDPPFRWRFAAGCYWGLKRAALTTVLMERIPLEDIECFNPRNPTGKEEYEKKHTTSSRWGVVPVERYARRMIPRNPRGVFDLDAQPAVGLVDFDLLPVGEREAVLFLSHKGLVRVWRGKAQRAESDLHEWDTTWAERKADSFPAPPGEPFLAYGDKDTWFLLTPSGKLYLSRKPARGRRRTLVPFYADEGAPLRALLTDCATGRTWAFAAPVPRLAGKRKPFYFELAEGARRRPYVLRPVKEAGLPRELATLLPYARVLRAAKLIK
jgi:hypothetical protein